MSKFLPEYHVFRSTIAASFAKRRKSFEFPSFYRFITERDISDRVFFYSKVLLVSVLSAMILLQIVVQAVTLQQNMKQAYKFQQERQKIVGEIAYWKTLETQYKGYRDIYFKIALLEYKLGKIDESRKYMKKVQQLDPNFEEGKVLGAKVGL